LSSEEPHNPGRPRKAYQLTKDGLTVLQAEISRLQNMLGRAQLPMAEESV
jgi:DNA-binding PadR family transcriptional regulator